MEEIEKFPIKIENLKKVFLERYPHKKDFAVEILSKIINDFLDTLTLEISTNDFKEIFFKYLKGTLYFDSEDFTKNEIRQIIDNSPLDEDDRSLALLCWCDVNTQEKMAEKLFKDRKTISNKISRISLILKKTASKMKLE